MCVFLYCQLRQNLEKVTREIIIIKLGNPSYKKLSLSFDLTL